MKNTAFCQAVLQAVRALSCGDDCHLPLLHLENGIAGLAQGEKVYMSSSQVRENRGNIHNKVNLTQSRLSVTEADEFRKPNSDGDAFALNFKEEG